MADRLPTKELLARRLEQIAAPAWLVDNARRGLYDDFDDQGHETPQIKLIDDLRLIAVQCHCSFALRDALTVVRAEVIEGKWDAQPWESDAWAAKQTGEMGAMIDRLDMREPRP